MSEGSAQYVIQASADVVQQAWRDWTEGWALGRESAVTISSDENSGAAVVTVPKELEAEFAAMMRYRGFK